jgi:hypothetical protein
MDEKMVATVNKIKLLAEQNIEFKNAMQKLFGNTASSIPHSDYNERIVHIEKYLGLDYYTDSMPSVIDYSYIHEIDVRAQLISDNREMLRFRYGTRFHEILFEEFCRYAQLQAEMLINYFYYHKETTIADAIDHIIRHNTTAIIDKSIFTLTSIPFSSKLWAFCNEFKLKKAKETFDFVRDVRNHQSHRNPNELDFSFFDYQKKLIEWGIKLKSDGSFDYYKTKENTLTYSIYETKIKNKIEFKLYQYHAWYNKKPYDEVISKLREISETVRNNL